MSALKFWRKRGVGLFFVVIVTMLVLVAFIGMFQMGFSRQVVDRMTKAALGEVCLELAESATAEALFEIKSRVNRPDSPYFSLFRQEVFGSQSGHLPLDVELKHFRRLLDDPSYDRFYLDDIEVEVAYQKQFSRMPYEKYGVLTCKATVGTNISLTNRVRRTVRTGCEFKVALVGPPRPFDQVGLMVCEASSIVSEANYRVRESVREVASIAKDRDEVIEMYRNRRGSISTLDVDRAISELQRLGIPSKSQLLAGTKEFVEPLTIFTIRETIELSSLDLPGRLDEATRAIAELSEDYRRSRDLLERNPGSRTALERYESNLARLVDVHKDRVSAVRSFQDYFIEYTGGARSDLAGFFYKLDEAEWRRKAFYVIREAEGDVNRALKRLKKRIKPVNGVIFVENSRQPLDLEGDNGVFDGNVIVVTTGSVHLGGGGGAGGLLTVISYGTVIVDGECRASIIANKRVSVGENSCITGNLILREVRDLGSLRGRVLRDPRLHSGRTVPGDSSGAFTDYYYVAIAPGETFTRIERR